MRAHEIITTGDARRLILETIMDLRNEDMDISRGLAIAANMKVLNDNMVAEANASRLKILAYKSGHDFGAVVRMGKMIICDDQKPMIEEEEEDVKKITKG